MAFVPIPERTNSPDKFQSHIISGIGPFNNPLSIYSKGHRTYNKIPYFGPSGKSGIIENIDIINEGFNIPSKNEHIKLVKQEISNDVIIPINRSGLSVDLKFGSSNVITTSNIFVNI